MTNPDFVAISAKQYVAIQKHARAAFEKAECWGVFPTKIDEVMRAAKVVVSNEDALNPTFLDKIRYKAGKARAILKSALTKILGVFDAGARIAYIDRAVLAVRQGFLKLHEAGHAILPWQREIYQAFEDCENTLSPECSEAFDQEANAFASEVMFQVERFTNEAAGHDFGIGVPLKLSKIYGGSVYATVRRYVSTHHRNCTVLVLNPTEMIPGDGFKADLRRAVSSPSFLAKFGNLAWPDQFTPEHEIGKLIPLGNRKMSGKNTIGLTDLNGVCHECLVEAFKTNYQTFILIVDVKAMTSATFCLSPALAH